MVLFLSFSIFPSFFFQAGNENSGPCTVRELEGVPKLRPGDLGCHLCGHVVSLLLDSALIVGECFGSIE